MIKHNRVRLGWPGLAALLLGSVSAIASQEDCGPPKLLEPQPYSTIPTAHPRIIWSAVQGAASYRVQIDSRVPEGGRVRALDVFTSEPAFTSPEGLSTHRARVDVTVTPICEGKAGSALTATTGGRFFIDIGMACPAVDGLTAVQDTSGMHVRWQQSSSAARYEARVFTAADGQLLFQAQTRVPVLSIPTSVRPPAVLAVRSVCPEGFGGTAFLLFE